MFRAIGDVRAALRDGESRASGTTLLSDPYVIIELSSTVWGWR